MYLFSGRVHEQERGRGRERERERERQNPKKPPHSVQSPMQGSIPWPWDHDLSQSQESDAWGAWVAQSVQCPTSAQVIISQFVSLSPASGSVLTAQSLEPVPDFVSPSLSVPPLLALCQNKETFKTLKKRKKMLNQLSHSGAPDQFFLAVKKRKTHTEWGTTFISCM